VSALLLVAPFMDDGLTIRFTEDVTSESYVEMTVGLLRQLGVRVEHDAADRTLTVWPGRLAGFELAIEPDASGATYPWGIGAVLPGVCVRVPGLSHPSLQGDAKFPTLLARMGAAVSSSPLATSVTGPAKLSGIEADLSLMPDAAMTLAAVACFASSPSVLRGLRTLRDKETDRVEATRAELTKIGVRVEVGVEVGPGGPADADALVISPPRGGVVCDGGVERVDFETYDDHRMAMALSLIALRRPNTWIKNPACVAKTYPGYWRELARVYAAAGARNESRELGT
jgi:3-phosphoshikimate 1-carboxyvinyltransferase